ncbi:secondary thiamine-phosphate synthase enzyme YjbQ [Aurantiacibacter sp. D1-12]|uniref:secondary thiamine-phosphate synthase enzyme YjbQ n=1 Tax=Aurantiacibacter sp. D1-12 TaxID=2993658 RepID=UPI00237CE4B8|nr:secondary thiamine-phosphate synthase enzyme YjbQ [Aurantiacibacter sp. D1-12]MDE1467116.1 secondary thiamine-phosphate synthase enzyme YjbQ [Aurantiacibacter sp. D1-12]
MHQHQTSFTLSTNGQALYEFTQDVESWLASTGITTGLVTLFCRHTSASLLINENAAPAVQRDLLRWLSKAAPESDIYEHDDEGPDDMPAHIRTMLTGASLSIPVVDGQLALGTWQGVYLAEHRRIPHTRRVVAHVIGE